MLDFQALSLDWKQIEEKIALSEYDFWGVTSTTVIAGNAYKIADLIKKYHPHTKIVLGGVHATALPEEGLLNQNIDYVIRGEGHQALIELVQGLPLDTIKGLSYRSGNEFAHIRPDGLMRRLDDIPMPAFDKVDLGLYKPAFGAYKRLPAINMMATRGCVGKCTFCNSANIPFRVRSAENIFSEMSMLRSKFGIREIQFYDDTFTVIKKNIHRLCDLLIENKLDITWCCFARTDCVTFELLKKMKAAGCHQVMYGIESVNKEILRNIKKNIDISKNKKAIEMAQRAGITVRCSFMLGSPGETAETMDETIKYSIQLNPDIAIYNITTPYPGTEMFKWAKDNNYLVTQNWEDYDLGCLVMRLDGVSEEELQNKYKQAFRRFYLRPSYIIKRIGKCFTRGDIATSIEGLKKISSFK
jgi:anaerobic magnesium-protoporphyrin IX monomethyl ester cyclase